MAQVLSETRDIEIGLLINNAGFANTGEFLENERAREVEMLTVNCRAPMLLAHEFGQHMKNKIDFSRKMQKPCSYLFIQVFVNFKTGFLEGGMMVLRPEQCVLDPPKIIPASNTRCGAGP